LGQIFVDLRSESKTAARSAFFTMATEHEKPLAGPAQVKLKSHLLRERSHSRGATTVLTDPSLCRPPAWV